MFNDYTVEARMARQIERKVWLALAVIAVAYVLVGSIDFYFAGV